MMPARNPRINVVLERPLYQAVERLAHRDQVSLSTKMRDLVREALELEEDSRLAAIAERRERSFVREAALSHARVWGQRSR
jgi:hypothetical protein